MKVNQVTCYEIQDMQVLLLTSALDPQTEQENRYNASHKMHT